MPDWPSEYQRIVHEARSRAVSGLTQETQQAMAREYARQVVRVLGELDRIDWKNDHETIRRRFLANLEDAMNRYAARSELQVKNFIEDAAIEAVQAHKQALSTASQATGVSVEASFAQVPERAIESMFARRGLDVTQSYKTLTRFSAQASARQVEDTLADAITGGRTPQEAVEGVMKGLVEGNPQAEEIIENLGPRGGTRIGGQVPDIEDARDVARKIGFNARRIALTEINQSWHESDRLSGAQSDVVKGMGWTLSAAHPERDECDLLATQDIYGLGPGVYPPETAPPLSHPFCLCSWEYVFWEPEEWGSETPVREPDRADEEFVRGFLSERGGSVTDSEVKRITNRFNKLTRTSYDYYQEAA